MMAGATPQKEKQQGITAAASAEDETLKRNTDCVYFLTSPLACKKGAECEYRHSEYARVNPRDCYFWLNGNCLNPKCGFRHPPLDGLFDTEEGAPVGSFLPPLRTAAAPAIYAHQYPGKAPVQCIYFQKGFCSRGDKCGFLHGPNPASNKISQQIIPAPSTEVPPTKPQSSHQKITQEIKTQQANLAKAVAEINPVPKLETGLQRNGIYRNLPIFKNLHDEVPSHKETNLPPVVNGNPSRHNRMHQSQVPDDHGILNGKDADEFLRESSPGFDVLVDDDHGEDQYGRTRGHERRNSNPLNEYDIGHSADYNSVGDMDRELYHDLRGYDNYKNVQGQCAWEQHRPSKVDSPELSDDMDLRYRLSKHKRGNGLRSVVSHDFASDKNVEDREHRGSSPRESSISGRLRGRIKLPRRSPSSSDLPVEREKNRVRSQGRLSPVRPLIPSHRGRFRDRIKSRVEEGDYDGSVHFAGPKSLAELKGSTSSEGRNQQPLRKRKHLDDIVDNNQPSEGELSFKGPMPLSEILKRKRVSKAGAASGTVMSSIDKLDNDQKELEENQAGSPSNTTVREPQSGLSSKAPAVEDENDGDDQREGEEYEYEQVDEGEYYEEGENAEAEDDDDDFAKKIGVIFS